MWAMKAWNPIGRENLITILYLRVIHVILSVARLELFATLATKIIFKVFRGRKRFDLSSSSFFRREYGINQ